MQSKQLTGRAQTCINNMLKPTTNLIEHWYTPYAIDKKTPYFDQVLDLLRLQQRKTRKAEENTRKDIGTLGCKFLIINVI